MAVIDITRNKVLSTISVPKGSHGLVVTPNGNRVLTFRAVSAQDFPTSNPRVAGSIPARRTNPALLTTAHPELHTISVCLAPRCAGRSCSRWPVSNTWQNGISRQRTLWRPSTVGTGGHVYVERAGVLGNVGS